MAFLGFYLLEKLTEHGKSLHVGLWRRLGWLTVELWVSHGVPGSSPPPRPWCTMRSKLTREVPLALSAPSLYFSLEGILLLCDLYPPGISKPFPFHPSGGQSCWVMLQSPLHIAPKSKLLGSHRHTFQEGCKIFRLPRAKTTPLHG